MVVVLFLPVDNGGHLGVVRTRADHGESRVRLAAEKDLHEDCAELLAEGAVDQDVHGAVDGDEEVGDLYDLLVADVPLKVEFYLYFHFSRHGLTHDVDTHL